MRRRRFRPKIAESRPDLFSKSWLALPVAGAKPADCRAQSANPDEIAVGVLCRDQVKVGDLRQRPAAKSGTEGLHPGISDLIATEAKVGELRQCPAAKT